MDNQVKVFARIVYGKTLVYPANETAEKFAHLLNVRTFNDAQLGQIEVLGFEVEQVADPTTKLGRGR